MSGRTQKFGLHLAIEKSGPAIIFFVDSGSNYSSLVGNEIEVMLRKKDIKKQILSKTLSAYRFSWYEQSWLSKLLMATTRLHWCLVFLVQSLRLETWKLLDTTWNISLSVTYTSERYARNLFIAVTMIWDSRVVKKPFLFVGITHFVLICKKPSILISDPKSLTRFLLQDK